MIGQIRRRVLLLSAQLAHSLARVTPATAQDALVLGAVRDLEDAARRLAAALATAERDGAL